MTMMTTDECFLSVYGTLRRHPWLSADDQEIDAYGLFNMYSEALRWSTSATYPRDSGPIPVDPMREFAMWAMNEAGGNWSDDVKDTADHLLWVQTGLDSASRHIGLPITQISHCAGKVLDRIGRVSLEGIQAMLPIGRTVTPRPEWYRGVLALANPENSALLQVEIDGGEDETLIRNSTQIIDELNSSCQRDRMQFTDLTVDKSSLYLLSEPEAMDRTGWMGPSRGRIRAQVSVPEFSLDLFSYLVNYLARSCRIAGVNGSILTTMRLA